MEYVIFTMLYLLIAIKSWELQLEGDSQANKVKRCPYFIYALCAIFWPFFMWFWIFFTTTDKRKGS